MDGKVKLDPVKLDDPHSIAPPGKEGAVKLDGDPAGRKMGLIKLGRGHQALLPTFLAAAQFPAGEIPDQRSGPGHVLTSQRDIPI